MSGANGKASLASISTLDEDLMPPTRLDLPPSNVPVPIVPAPVARQALDQATTGVVRRGKGSVIQPIDDFADELTMVEPAKKHISFRIEVDLDRWINRKVTALKDSGKKMNREQLLNHAVRMLRAGSDAE